MSRSCTLLVVLALLYASSVSAQTTNCQGAGFDLSSIANVDLSWIDAPMRWQYFVRPCGFVANSNCTGIVGFTSTLCQYGPTSITAHSLSTYSLANSTWVAERDGKSVTQSMSFGEYCSSINAYRQTEFAYICDPAATTPFLYNVTEGQQSSETCHVVQASSVVFSKCRASLLTLCSCVLPSQSTPVTILLLSTRLRLVSTALHLVQPALSAPNTIAPSVAAADTTSHLFPLAWIFTSIRIPRSVLVSHGSFGR